MEVGKKNKRETKERKIYFQMSNVRRFMVSVYDCY